MGLAVGDAVRIPLRVPRRRICAWWRTDWASRKCEPTGGGDTRRSRRRRGTGGERLRLWPLDDVADRDAGTDQQVLTSLCPSPRQLLVLGIIRALGSVLPQVVSAADDVVLPSVGWRELIDPCLNLRLYSRRVRPNARVERLRQRQCVRYVRPGVDARRTIIRIDDPGWVGDGPRAQHLHGVVRDPGRNNGRRQRIVLAAWN